MKNGTRALLLAAALFTGYGAAAAAPAGHVSYPSPRSYFEARVNLAEPEQARIRAHLAAVETLLRANPPPDLTPAQAANRSARLDDLRAYRERGVFPKNLDFPDRLIPYFIDAAGTPCAMGYLVIQSGAGDFAEEIRTTRNNAYIAELAAMDGRLAAWAEEQGMTVEEAAMVQPGYGPPSMTGVWRIELDSQGRPWVMGPDNNNIGNEVIGYRDSLSWKVAPAASASFGSRDFCLASDGRALVLLGADGAAWPLTATTAPGFTGRLGTRSLASCAWQAGDSVAWAGGSLGLTRIRRADFDTLSLTAVTSPAGASDSITVIAVGGERVWAGTRHGLYARQVDDVDSVVAWDSLALGGRHVTGLEASGSTIWVGLEGPSDGRQGFRFSTRGLRRIQGDSVSTYRATMSSVQVPDDTVYALAPRDSASAWIATPSGFYRFSGTASTPKVADLPASGAFVTDMAGDSTGFYVATAAGVYRYDGDSLAFIGSPVVSLRSDVVSGRSAPVAPLRIRLVPGTASDGYDAAGRALGSRAAAGVTVRSPERESPDVR